jgi:hypothetical protein
MKTAQPAALKHPSKIYRILSILSGNFSCCPQGEPVYEPPPLTAVHKDPLLCVLCASAVNNVISTPPAPLGS